MVLEVLGNFTYRPSFCKGMEVEFKRLSARDELKIVEGSGNDDRVAMFLASIVEIRNPIQLKRAGELADMVPEDIVSVPELKPLFYELLKEYTKRTAVTEENVKKR
jgi:hypothetical protein